MKPLHLTAVILLMSLLAACGGGGGSGGERTMATVETEPLPVALPIANTEQATALVGGHAPLTATDPEEIRATLRGIAGGANTLLFSEINDGDEGTRVRVLDCTRHGICTGTFGEGINARRVQYNVRHARFFQPEEIDDVDLAGYQDWYSLVMTRRGIPFAQSSGTGTAETVRLEHQSYGGWLLRNAFTIRLEKFTDTATGDDEGVFLLAHSFGKSSASNPNASTTWKGVMVGATREHNHIVQGDATVEFVMDSPDSVSVTFENIKNFNTNDDAETTRIAWPSIPLENGVFTAVNKSVEGRFYGDTHEEAGGVFNMDGIVGAFGAGKMDP